LAQVIIVVSKQALSVHLKPTGTTMKTTFVALAGARVAASESSPIGKVLTMISDLEAYIIKEGEVVQKEYAEFSEWCEERSRNVGFEMKTGQAEVEELQAAIAQETATTGSLQTKVEELAAGITTDEADLKAGSEIRGKEAKVFAAEEKDLAETIDMLQRASGILERQMQGGASMMQLKNAGNVVEAFQAMVQASLIGSSDASKLTAFVQNVQKEADEDGDAGAPAGAVYESQGGGIVEVIQDLLEKAEDQLATIRKTEQTNQHNFNMLEQSLKDEIKFGNKDFDEAKKGIAASGEKQSTAEGDLAVTKKDLAVDTSAKATLHHDCMTKATNFAAETKSRGEELKALAAAKKIIKEATTSFAQVSFVQVSELSTSSDLAKYEVVRFVRDLARKEHSTVLAQLASHMASAMHSSDPFGKVKSLITDMIAKLENQAGADATEKAYCDKEMRESNEKKADKTAEIETMSTRIDQAAAKSAKLKEEVATLETELSKLAKSQAEMDKLRGEEKAAYEENKAELEKGLAGIKAALKVLNEYYARDDKAHEAADGASSGIVGLLEVIEADFTKDLAQVNTDEEMAVAEYEKETKENEIEKTTKDQDVAYKGKEAKELDKYAAELNSDRAGVQDEFDAVAEYLSKLEARCIAKAETYSDRAARRAAEIAGLKEALHILESETALVQSARKRGSFRGRLQV